MTNNFINFIEENNIISTVISTTLGFKTKEMVESLINDLIIPIINIDLNNDGKSEIKNLESFKITFLGITLNFGKFITNLIKYILVIYIVYN